MVGRGALWCDPFRQFRYGALMFVEVRCVLFRLLCRVEEGSDQLGYVALRYGSPLEASRGLVCLY